MPGAKPRLRPVKLICGVLFRPSADLESVAKDLQLRLGPIDLRSPVFEFIFTDYYEKEMGKALKKEFLSFERLVMPDCLPDIKISTIAIENEFAVDGARIVNIDPGYLEESKLVLASTKNFSHRVYLRDNIWAEVTLRYVRGQFVKHDWTYPDYSQPLAIDFLKNVREIYRRQLDSQP